MTLMGKWARIDLTVVVPVLHETAHLDRMLPELARVLEQSGVSWELIVADSSGSGRIREIAEAHGACHVPVRSGGYGTAILSGLEESLGEYIMTMDPDAADVASAVRALWDNRGRSDLLVASRYIGESRVEQPALRQVLSRTMNRFFSKVLSTPLNDLSTGFRLYRRRVFERIAPEMKDLAFLLEVLLKAYGNGIDIVETPFHYKLHGYRLAQAHGLKLGFECFWSLFRLWRMRNSVQCADYDLRAYDSRIPLQRWWQRRRHDAVLGFVPQGGLRLDAGCGSGRIIADMPDAVGVDIRHDKLRYMRRTNRLLAQCNGLALPFPDEAFDCVLSSEVIEHIPDEDGRFIDELSRVLKPGGILVLGTPDYGRWEWSFFEWLYVRVAPNAYAHEHVTHYTYESLRAALEARGFAVLDRRYVFNSVMVLQARKNG